MRTSLLLVLVALASGCGPTDSTSPRFPGAPVVLISIDTLRADHLPAYGYSKVETPGIDAFRRDGILFENAYSHCPLTLPSHLSMLTGVLPAEHGVRSNLGYRFDGAAHPTLARILRRRGYATGAAVSSYVLRRATGIDDSWDFFDDNVGGKGESTRDVSTLQRAGGETARRVLSWISSVRAKPFFVFLHIFEPHLPHDPPEPFRSRYGATYDGEVAAADAVVGEFLGQLKRDGVYDRAIVFVVSDHGEGLGDHGEQEHGILLYREALHVPLLLKLPGAREAGTRVNDPVGLIDIVPTVASLLGLDDGAPEGVSLLDRRGAGSAPSRAIFSETYYPQIHFGWSRLRSLVNARDHYIDGPKPELYDVARDPGETSDVAGARPDVARAMKEDLARYPERFETPGHVDPEEAERLEALGYVSGIAPAGGGDALPNPRDRIHAHERLRAAARLAAQGRNKEALAALSLLIEEEPASFEARRDLAGTLARLGRFEEAVAAYKDAMRLSPQLAGTVVLPLGLAELEMGRFADAEARARAALDEEPSRAQQLLARVALARGDLAAAESHARKAMADSVEGAVILAQVHVRRSELPRALAVLDEGRARAAASGIAPPAGLGLLRADVLGRLGRFAEAESELRSELRTFPGRAQTWASLAVMVALQGRPRGEVHRILDSMAEANPGPDAIALGAKTLAFLGDEEGARSWRRREASPKPR